MPRNALSCRLLTDVFASLSVAYMHNGTGFFFQTKRDSFSDHRYVHRHEFYL